MMRDGFIKARMTPNEKRRHVEEVGATGDNYDVGKP
jgi:hypothetical protein